MLGYIATAAGLGGILLAYLFYVVKPAARRFDGDARSAAPYRWLYNKYFVDEAYDAMVVEPVVQGSRIGAVGGIDAGVIDGIVNGIGRRSRNIGGGLKLLQSGNIRSYAAWVVLGSLVVIVAMGLIGGVR